MLTYYNAPVWLADASVVDASDNRIVTGDAGETGKYLIAAQKVDVSYSASKEAARIFGQSGSYDQPHNKPLDGVISFEAYYLFDYFTNRDPIEQFTGNNLDGSSEANIRVGNLVFKKCYMNNFRISADPSKGVVKYNASFNFYSGATGRLEETSYSNVDGALNYSAQVVSPDIAAAHTMTINGNDLGQSISVEYGVNCPRIPSYRLGDEIPTSVKLLRCEKTATIRGSLTDFINYSGRSAYMNVSGRSLGRPSTPLSVKPFFNITGEITAQNFSAPTNGIINGSVTIREVLV
jgi:hypothetical protein